MAYVENHLSVEDLAARYRACEDVCSARHYQTIWLLVEGHTVGAVSAITSFVPRWIEELLARYNAFGEAALGEPPRPRIAAVRSRSSTNHLAESGEHRQRAAPQLRK
jgi:hypothetical protein